VICNRDADDATMPVLPGVGVRRQPAASVFLEPASVHLAQIKCLYQPQLDGAAAEDSNKKRARAFNPQKTARKASEGAAGPGREEICWRNSAAVCTRSWEEFG